MNTSDMLSVLALMIAVVSGVSPHGRPIVRQVHEEHSLQVLPSGVLAKSTLPLGVTPSSSTKDELFAESQTAVADSSKTGASASRSSIVAQGLQALVRDDRPALVIFKDEKCETELSGFWLPAELEISDGSCIKTVADMENQTAKMQKGTSMTWSCGVSSDDPNLQVARVVSHFGTNCSMGDDDTRKFTIAAEDFASVRDGGCTKAANREADVIYYIMVMNAKTVGAWPTCMKESMVIMFVCIALALTCILVIFYQVLTRWILPLTSGQGKKKSPDLGMGDDNDTQQEGLTAPSGEEQAAAPGGSTTAQAQAAATVEAKPPAPAAKEAEEVDF